MAEAKEKHPVSEEEWETPTGLINDVDAWVARAYFGFRDEYQKAIVAGGGGATDSPMLLVVLENEDGEELATQGYSCGAGWLIQGDGERIEHPLRANIIKTSIYGQLITRVRDGLKVPMHEYGSPLVAETWQGLGFHWKQEEHKTVGGDTRSGLMPTEFLGEREYAPKTGPAAAARKAAVAAPASELEKKLTDLARLMEITPFQRAALKIKEVIDNDELMGSIMNEGEDGFWATHQEK